MTTETAPIIMISKTSKTTYQARVDGYETVVNISYKAGWSAGGNNYGIAQWIISRPGVMFAIHSCPAHSNNPRTITKRTVAFIHGYITERG